MRSQLACVTPGAGGSPRRTKLQIITTKQTSIPNQTSMRALIAPPAGTATEPVGQGPASCLPALEGSEPRVSQPPQPAPSVSGPRAELHLAPAEGVDCPRLQYRPDPTRLKQHSTPRSRGTATAQMKIPEGLPA